MTKLILIFILRKFRHACAISGIAVACGLVIKPSVAADFPSKPMVIVVPFSAGGTLDQFARLVGQGFVKTWGQPVVVENRLGAGGNIGTEFVAKSPADGYTMLMISVGFTSNPALYKKLAFDPVNDFAPVTLMATAQNVLIVHPSVPAKSVKDLIWLAKAGKGQLNFSSSGTGTSQHLAGELFKSMAGIEMQHIPYRGGPLGLTALISGEVSLMFNNLFTAIPYVRGGRLRALGVTSSRRSSGAPEIPTIAESGLPGFDVSTWYGMLTPAKTPREIILKINNEVGRILNQNDTRERLRDVLELTPSTPEQFALHIKQEMVKWEKVVKQSGARVD